MTVMCCLRDGYPMRQGLAEVVRTAMNDGVVNRTVSAVW